MAAVQDWPLNDFAGDTVLGAAVGTAGVYQGGDFTNAKRVDGPGGLMTFGLDFNGTDDYGDISAAAVSFAPASPLSVSWWWRPDSTAGIFLGRADANTSTVRQNTTTTILIQFASGHTFVVPTISMGAWHHGLMTKTAAGVIRVFVDGVESTSGPQSLAGETFAPTTIGRRNLSYNDGRLARVRIYDTDETANASAIYAEGLLVYGLLAHWALDEGSGTREDSHGANDLADVNAVPGVLGKIGGAASFTAASLQALSAGTPASLDLGNADMTIAGWIYGTDVGQSRTVIGKSSSTAASLMQFQLRTVSNRLRMRISDGAAIVDAAHALNLTNNNWHFFVAWYDAAADTINIEVDNAGLVSAAQSAGFNTSQQNLSLARLGSNATQMWDGRLDAMSYYNRVLTADEKTRLYNAGAGLSYAAMGPPGPSSLAQQRALGIGIAIRL